MRVPRWRTIIVPPVTVSPEKRFTPSLFEWLSLLFFVLPPPFLCAISLFLSSTLNNYLSVLRSRAHCSPVVFAPLILENPDLFSTNRAENLGLEFNIL